MRFSQSAIRFRLTDVWSTNLRSGPMRGGDGSVCSSHASCTNEPPHPWLAEVSRDLASAQDFI